jgi:protein-S-isoprenylcysteine O-methyltransferase Ste14
VIDWRDRITIGGQIVVSLFVIGAFSAVVILAYFVEVPQNSQRTFDTMVGFLGAAFMAIVGLWTGTTISSQKKDAVISDAAKAAAAKVP